MNKVAVFFIITFFSLTSVFAKNKGYFDSGNGSEYLDFSNMNKEFKITSLMNSAIANDAKATKIFIASGAEVNQKNIAGATALHLAVRNNSFESAQVLIENGAKVNERDSEGWTPLMRASLAGNQKMMTLLMENGAKVWEQNRFGETALMHTAMADCYECGKLILEKDDGRNNVLVNDQAKQSLQIVNKRYNEPFIELITAKLNGGEVLALDDTSSLDKKPTTKTKNTSKDAQDGTLVQLVYVFTGKTITKEEMNEIGKSIYDSSKQEKEKSKKIKLKDNKIEDKKPVVETKPTETKPVETKPTEIKPAKKENSYSFDGSKKSSEEVKNEAEKIKAEIKEQAKEEKKKTIVEPTKQKEEIKPVSYSFTGTKKKLEEQKIDTKNVIIEDNQVKNSTKPAYNFTGKNKSVPSFNSGIEEKRNNMKIINNNDKLNPDKVEYTLKNDGKLLNK